VGKLKIILIRRIRIISQEFVFLVYRAVWYLCKTYDGNKKDDIT
jgi:hypothetical protein